MTDKEIAIARAIIDAATPGNWQATQCQSRVDWMVFGPVGALGYLKEDDARFIAAARTGWPAALDALEEERSTATKSFMRSFHTGSHDVTYQRGVVDGRRGHPPAELSVNYLRGYADGLEGQ